MGLLLGDGHIQKRSINGNSRFIYGQSSLRLHHFADTIFYMFSNYLSPISQKILFSKKENLWTKEPKFNIVQ